MNYFDRFKKKMEISGGSLRNEILINSRNLIEETFFDDPSFTTGIYRWDLDMVSYQKFPPVNIRLYKRYFSTANGNSIKFQTLIDTPVIVGDVLYDSNTESYWICIESFNIDNIHFQGKLYECNWILKWQDKSGRILEYPCQDQNSTQYNSGITSNKQFSIGSSQHMITLPYDKNTVLIRGPQRFYLDKSHVNPVSYIVTQNDTTSYNFGKKGLVKITLTECVGDYKNDRPDLGVCDYKEPSSFSVTSNPNIVKNTSEILYDSDIITSGGNCRTYIGIFYDNAGEVLSNVVAKWSIQCDFEDQLTVSKKNNQIKIGVDNDELINEEFKLILSDENDNYSSTLNIKIGSLL